MESNKFRNLIKKDKYQVFLFSCPAVVPFQIGLHHWFVINRKGQISRWEILKRKNVFKTSFGHLCLNVLSPTKGTKVLPPFKKFWNSKLEGFIEGDRNSLAKKMTDFIETSSKSYPYKNRYNLFYGPNSNTFIQWIISRFPRSGFKLSWRAVGKNYLNKF